MKKPKTTTVKSAPKPAVKKEAATETAVTKPAKPSTAQSTPKKKQAKASESAKTAPPMAMSDRIGLTAGDVWQYLDKNGATTVSTLLKEIAEDEKIIQRSIGWLAQEGKLAFTSSGRVETVALIQ